MRAYYYRLATVSGMIACASAAALATEGPEYKVGVEAFYDNYKEPISSTVEVNEKAYFGAVNGAYIYNWSQYMAAAELRASYGRDDYKSPSGTLSNIPQYEFEGRMLGGFRLPIDGGGSVFVPYLGLGSRYFFDNAKGLVTNLGAHAYDRRILQFYLPIGVSAHLYDNGWVYSPLLEFDPLLAGKVNTRLGSIAGYENINTTQHRGWGWRGEFMVGQQYKDFGWEAGPYFRYWDIKDSNTATDSSGNVFYEPQNTRLQAGASVRFNF